jgi:hypothetical protein
VDDHVHVVVVFYVVEAYVPRKIGFGGEVVRRLLKVCRCGECRYLGRSEGGG